MGHLEFCPGCDEKFVDLGWLNNEFCKPVIVKFEEKCRLLGHQRKDIDISGSRGMEHVVTCKECRVVYRYDSSD